MRIFDEPIIIEQTFNCSTETVWRSITEIDQMRQWYFEEISSFKPKVGFETQFNTSGPSRNFLHMWKVTEVVPQKKISYDWKYEGIPGDSRVEFELFDQNNQTMLRVTHYSKEDFPDDIPEFSRESGVEGWKYFIRKSLKEYLEGTDND